MSAVDLLILENERLRAACIAARVGLATSYGCTEPLPRTVAAIEQPSPAWAAAAAACERRLGVRLWKYFG